MGANVLAIYVDKPAVSAFKVVEGDRQTSEIIYVVANGADFFCGI
jgi:hypothetical protein